MKKLCRLSLGLDSNQYHAGLSEICAQFEESSSDEYMNGLVSDLANANSALLASMHIAEVRLNVSKEDALLRDQLVAASRYIDSCCYVSDETMKTSAMVVKQVFDSYAKPFAWMNVDERVGAVSTLLRDLASPKLQEHVARLSELANRITNLQAAYEALQDALLEVDKIKGTVPKGQSLMSLKREASARLVTLVDYLEAMAVKQPDDYAEHLAVVMQIIGRLNTRRRKSNNLQIEVELEDDVVDEPAESPDPSPEGTPLAEGD